MNSENKLNKKERLEITDNKDNNLYSSNVIINENYNSDCEEILNNKAGDKKEMSNLLPKTESDVAPTIVKNINVNSIEEKKRKSRKKKKFISEPCGSRNTRPLKLLSMIICLGLALGVLYTCQEHIDPGGNLMTFLSLVLASHFGGNLAKFCGIPPLVGMLVAGIAMGNIGIYQHSNVYDKIAIVGRQLALTNIMIMAGLGLDARLLKRLGAIVLELSFIPCIAEAIGVAVFARIFLNFPWLWGLLLGWIMGAVTPAIVVPALLNLRKQGYDPDKRISTVVIAAASFDDIVAISGYGIVLGMLFDKNINGNFTMNILKSPLEILIGILYGTLWGILSAWIPHKTDKNFIVKRVFMIGGGGIFAVLGSSMLGYSGAGPLICVTSSFVAAMCWRWQGWSYTYNPVLDIFSSMWLFFEPAIFALVGVEITLSLIEPETAMVGILVIVGGLVVRCAACTVVLITGKYFNAHFSGKEILFINIAWLPKATVQAALGPIALGVAVAPEDIRYSETVLMIAVLSILLTAPLGSIGMSISGPLLLKKKSVQTAELAIDV